jgi:hypothetical protein
MKMCDLTHIYKVVGDEVVTAVIMNNTVLWDMTACSMVEVNRRFGEEKTSHATRKKKGALSSKRR